VVGVTAGSREVSGRKPVTRDSNDDENNNNNNTGTSDMGTINCSDRIAATLYSLVTLFVSGIYV
jgi:hypothetical protein